MAGDLKKTAQTLFAGISDSYDRLLREATLYQDRYWKNWMVNKARLRKAWSVLDLACGTCLLEEHLRSVDCSIIGLDLTERMIRIAQRKKIQHVKSLLVGDAEKLPYADNAFDAVLSCYLAKYCELRVLVAEVRRVLKPGGKLVLYDFSKPSGVFALFHALYVYGALRLMGRVTDLADNGLSYAFTMLPKIIARSGWEERLEEALYSLGFDEVGKRKLSGGVITAFWASKPEN